MLSVRILKNEAIDFFLFLLSKDICVTYVYRSAKYCKSGFIGTDVILGQPTICMFGTDFILGQCVILYLQEIVTSIL